VKDPDGAPNRTEDFPFLDVARDGHDLSPYRRWRDPIVDYKWLGKVRNSEGSYFEIEPGRYRMRWAVLRPFGNPSNSDAWDVTHTDVTVQYSAMVARPISA
jgi:hypothetical protein